MAKRKTVAEWQAQVDSLRAEIGRMQAEYIELTNSNMKLRADLEAQWADQPESVHTKTQLEEDKAKLQADVQVLTEELAAIQVENREFLLETAEVLKRSHGEAVDAIREFAAALRNIRELWRRHGPAPDRTGRAYLIKQMTAALTALSTDEIDDMQNEEIDEAARHYPKLRPEKAAESEGQSP